MFQYSITMIDLGWKCVVLSCCVVLFRQAVCKREPRLLISPFSFKIHIASVTKRNVQGQLSLERVLGPNLEKGLWLQDARLDN